MGCGKKFRKPFGKKDNYDLRCPTCREEKKNANEQRRSIEGAGYATGDPSRADR